MYKYLILLGLACVATCEETKARRYDPFAALDRHISHTLAYHYLWPWSQLVRAAAALDEEQTLEASQMSSEPGRYEITMNVKRFKPEELKVRVRDRYILIEGKHKEKGDDQRFSTNHFVQSFAMPAGSKEEEVTAVLKENGVLSVFGPRHEVPKPPPEREVPIIVQKTETERKKEYPAKKEPTEKKEQTEKKILSEKKNDNRVEKEQPTTVKEASMITSSASPIELDMVEATTHVGKIRKKELKTTTKTSKDNEVTKGGEGNGLDYALIESDE